MSRHRVAPVGRERSVGGNDDLAHHRVDDEREQLVLRAHVVVERHRAGVELGRDAAHRHRAEPFGVGDADRGGRDLLAGEARSARRRGLARVHTSSASSCSDERGRVDFGALLEGLASAASLTDARRRPSRAWPPWRDASPRPCRPRSGADRFRDLTAAVTIGHLPFVQCTARLLVLCTTTAYGIRKSDERRGRPGCGRRRRPGSASSSATSGRCGTSTSTSRPAPCSACSGTTAPGKTTAIRILTTLSRADRGHGAVSRASTSSQQPDARARAHRRRRAAGDASTDC